MVRRGIGDGFPLVSTARTRGAMTAVSDRMAWFRTAPATLPDGARGQESPFTGPVKERATSFTRFDENYEWKTRQREILTHIMPS
jgi:hypothetical protein